MTHLLITIYLITTIQIYIYNTTKNHLPKKTSLNIFTPSWRYSIWPNHPGELLVALGCRQFRKEINKCLSKKKISQWEVWPAGIGRSYVGKELTMRRHCYFKKDHYTALIYMWYFLKKSNHSPPNTGQSSLCRANISPLSFC